MAITNTPNITPAKLPELAQNTSPSTNANFFRSKGYQAREIKTSQKEEALVYTNAESQFIEITDGDANPANNKIYQLKMGGGGGRFSGIIEGREVKIHGNQITPKLGGGVDRTFGVSEIMGKVNPQTETDSYTAVKST